MSDDGVGSHIANRLSSQFCDSESVTVLDGGTLSFTLLADVQHADRLIVIDAAELNQPPGTVRCLLDEDMDRHLRGGRKSVHEVGLADLLDMARLSERLPSQRALVAIQPADTGWGEQPSPAVAAAMDRAEQQVERLLAQWPGTGVNSASSDSGAKPEHPLDTHHVNT